jgi:hypothetical protein
MLRSVRLGSTDGEFSLRILRRNAPRCRRLHFCSGPARVAIRPGRWETTVRLYGDRLIVAAPDDVSTVYAGASRSDVGKERALPEPGRGRRWETVVKRCRARRPELAIDPTGPERMLA